jgi:EAL domain-containing protein (putative c-di-GMP-specific phosphodiesterase class I)
MPYAVYDKSILKEKYQFDLLSMFSDALRNDDTFMVYQPVIRSDNEVESLEALIRWKNPVHGLIMPNDFIPLVESTQLIHPMTEWVIKKVVKKQNEMKEVGIDIPLSINLSVKNLYDQSFHKLVKAIIQEEKGNPEKIIFEITETMLLKQNEHLQENLNRLKECGFKFAIDDFGKGYSSMSYLCQYPLDYIKIDRFFINEVAKNKSMFEIVSTMIKLAHQLNLQVVAEGVETKEINDMIHLMDCKLIQGYFIAKPMEDSTVIDWIKEYGKSKDIEKLKSS